MELCIYFLVAFVVGVIMLMAMSDNLHELTAPECVAVAALWPFAGCALVVIGVIRLAVRAGLVK